MASTIKADTLQSTTSNVFVLNSAGTEYARFDSSGNLGIGISSPGAKLDVNGAILSRGDGTEGGELRLNNITNSAVALLLDIDSSNNVRIYNNSATNTIFYTNATERMRIDSAGLLTLASGQIKFPASQNASSDANTLDDYEEGTFTPNLVNNGSSSTFTVKNGWYRKVGSLVTMWVDIDGGNSGTAGSQLQIVNLPFTFLTGPRGAMNGGFWAANSLAANNGGLNPQGTTNYANIYIGGGSVTGQATYMSATIIGMTSA